MSEGEKNCVSNLVQQYLLTQKLSNAAPHRRHHQQFQVMPCGLAGDAQCPYGPDGMPPASKSFRSSAHPPANGIEVVINSCLKR